ncbi:MAG: hypothetical protein R6U32_02860 [Candidatus Woesearchaeota archaeon]
MLKCPICNKPEVTLWRKVCVGPANTIRCGQCGGRIGVPYSSLLYGVPFLMAVAYLFISGINVVSVLALTLTFIFGLVMRIRYVPLIPKENITIDLSKYEKKIKGFSGLIISIMALLIMIIPYITFNRVQNISISEYISFTLNTISLLILNVLMFLFLLVGIFIFIRQIK